MKILSNKKWESLQEELRYANNAANSSFAKVGELTARLAELERDYKSLDDEHDDTCIERDRLQGLLDKEKDLNQELVAKLRSADEMIDQKEREKDAIAGQCYLEYENRLKEAAEREKAAHGVIIVEKSKAVEELKAMFDRASENHATQMAEKVKEIEALKARLTQNRKKKCSR